MMKAVGAIWSFTCSLELSNKLTPVVRVVVGGSVGQ